MTHTFTAHLRVRQYELDSRDELPNSALARLFQETAMQATQDAGFNVEWYTEHRSVWVIHELTLEHLRPIRYPDKLAITSWLSDIERIRTHREYLARNASSGEIVARGRALWIHLNRENLLPARIPAEIVERFAPNGMSAIPRLKPRVYPPPQSRVELISTRRVQRYEIDAMQHVNNAIYIDWFEEALAEAVNSHPSLESRLCVRRHDIEFTRGALPDDHVEIVTRLIGAGQCASVWAQEVRRADELLVRNRSTVISLDSQGRPARWK